MTDFRTNGVLSRRNLLLSGCLSGLGSVLPKSFLEDVANADENVEQKGLSPAVDATPVDVGTRLELFVDRFIVGRLDGTELRLHEPRDEGAVFAFDKPWEGGACAYATVLKDDAQNVYRLYYRGGPSLGHFDNTDEVTCCAESVDGVRWEKPEFGLFEFNGSKKNNIVLQGNAEFCHNFAPFIDLRENVPVDERYKALAGSQRTGLCAFVSEDGIRWRKLQEEPVIFNKKFGLDSQNVSFWSESERKYVCYLRIVDKNGFRSISRVESDDFRHWTPEDGREIDFGEPLQEHLYTNQTAPYYRAPHIYLSTAARFMQGKRIVSPEESLRLQIGWGQDSDCSDSVLMSSRGGVSFDRSFKEGLIRPDFGLENWNSRSNYPARGIVPTGKYEASLYVRRHYGQPIHSLHRYSIRVDGLVSVFAPYSGGNFWTKPLLFTGKRLLVNASTSAAGSIRVEALAPDGTPYLGFELENAPELTGNWIENEVGWNENADFSSLVGKPVVFRFAMKDADLYSIRFA